MGMGMGMGVMRPKPASPAVNLPRARHLDRLAHFSRRKTLSGLVQLIRILFLQKQLHKVSDF
jgi:hypothetical protein